MIALSPYYIYIYTYRERDVLSLHVVLSCYVTGGPFPGGLLLQMVTEVTRLPLVSTTMLLCALCVYMLCVCMMHIYIYIYIYVYTHIHVYIHTHEITQLL